MLKRVTSGFSALVLSLTSLFVFAPAIASAAVDVCTWDGSASLNWNTAANWTCATDGEAVPGAGDSLVFDNSDITSPNNQLENDISGGSFANITFQGDGAYSFSFEGNAFTLTGTITDDSTEARYPSIGNDMVIVGDKTLSIGSSSSLYLYGDLTGSGNITKTGAGYLYLGGNNAGHTGAVNVNGGSLGVSAGGLASTGGVTVNNTADISLTDCTVNTYTGSLTLDGASSIPSGEFKRPKFSVSNVCKGGGGLATEVYGVPATGDPIIFSGSLSLANDITFSSVASSNKFTGALYGKYKFIQEAGEASTVVIESSNNGSAMANGTYSAEIVTKTLADDLPESTVELSGRTVITINGKRSDVTVRSGGTLKGNGSVKALNVLAGGYVAPGNSPGCLSSNNLRIAGTYIVEIGGTAACTGYDQMKVTGTVDLTNGLISAAIVNKYQPVAGAKYTIIDNDGADKITGTLKDLAEGATFKTPSGTVLKISYVGGDGNDVTLTVVSVGTPDTGFGMLLNSPLTILAAATLAAGAILMMSRRLAPATAKRSRR